MSAPEIAAHGTRQQPRQLLVVIDPLARRSDGESVRIAKDVLCAGAPAKICLPDTPEEFARALARRGHRRPVVVGDDQALLRTVALLHRERELGTGVLAFVPVGAPADLVLARSLRVPVGAVAAARAVLDGVERHLDLLVDDSDGVVLDGLHVPALPEAADAARPAGPAVWRACRSLVRGLVRPVPAPGAPAETHRLRVEADGELLNDLDRPVREVTVRSPGDGSAEVAIRLPDAREPLLARAGSVTISGADFRYGADTRVAGPVRTRTWTLHPEAWSLTLPPER
ncbi:diacylglycerol kinase [Streptomyces fuscigenes]|uniref:diacylglycerol kinase n=1 Tax=Streptomyces fuscigenes TaxID=1528880 RepID=UPI001F40F3EB|nr:diacylglycerol kinase [Streptomyces fuscigenes]MCF3962195.1 diacylglycerol kinase [Streptomyces fuscigenes]